MADDTIRELWKIKDTIALEHDHDIEELVAELKKKDRPAGQRVVNLTAAPRV
jgi:predicted DNA-binding ribbon-helix-helix protein